MSIYSDAFASGIWADLDSAMSDSSRNPVENRAIKAYIDGQTTTIDSALSSSSENPVQNKVINTTVSSLNNQITAIDDRIVDGIDTETATVSGSVLSFSNGGDDVPVEDLTVDIEPVQSGSGDPSPDNVRPITGWTGMNVTRTGTNLCEGVELGSINSTTGQEASSSSIYRNIGYIRVQQEEIYYLTGLGENAGFRCFYYDDGKTFISSSVLSKDDVVTFSGNGYCRFQFSQEFYISNEIQFTSYADADYEAYNGQTYTIDWTSEAGTVYGGILDVTTGVLTVTHANIASYAGETINEPWISSMDVYSEGATPTTGAQVVYTLASPTTVQLTATEVTTLLGNNVLWADTGDSDLTYVIDTGDTVPTAAAIKAYIAQVIANLS